MDASTAGPGGRDGAIGPADPGLPSYPRPVDAPPGVGTAGSTRLACDVGCRRDKPLHAMGGADAAHERWPGGPGPGGHVRLFAAARPGGGGCAATDRGHDEVV